MARCGNHPGSIQDEIEKSSLDKLGAWIHKRKMEEELGTRKPSREELVARNNAKPLVVLRRSSTNKPGLNFCAIGSWGS